MKKTSKITLCAITASLATVFMLLSYFQYLTYAIPAVCGLFMMLPLIEVGALWACSSFAVSAVLSLLLAEPQAACLYVFFFGFYPIFKALIERINNVFLEWIIKIAFLNGIAAVIAFFFSKLFFGESFTELLNTYGYYAIPVILLLQFVFAAYDIGISRVSVFYVTKIHPQIKKGIK